MHLYRIPSDGDICGNGQQNVWHIAILLYIDFGQKEQVNTFQSLNSYVAFKAYYLRQ